MAYQPFGQFQNPRDLPRPYQSVKEELIFEDGAIAHSAGFEAGTRGWIIRSDGSVEFNTAVFRGDILSSNWDGTSPANLATVDAGATVGFYLDASVGAAQFMGDLFIGGDATLTTGGVFRTAASGQRINISSAILTEISFLTGNETSELNDRGFIITGDDGTYGTMEIQPPQRAGAEAEPSIWMGTAVAGQGGTSQMRFDIQGTRAMEIKDQRIEFAVGNNGAPGIGPLSDPDTGIWSNAADELNVTAGARHMMKFVEGTTDYVETLVDQHRFSTGLVGTPSISFSQTDLGFYRSTTDQLSLTVAGTQRFRIGTGRAEFVNLDALTIPVKTTTGDPTGAEGALYLNTFDNLLRIFANGSWQTVVGGL